MPRGRRAGEQSQEITNIRKRESIAILKMRARDGFSQFQQEWKTGDQLEVSCPPSLQNLCGVPRGVIRALMRMLVSRTALGTPTPTARRGNTSDEVHSVSGVLKGLPSGLGAVLCPYTVEHSEEAVAFCGECLITIEIDHSDDRFPVLFHNHRVFLAGHPPNQLGKDGLGSLLAQRFDHTRIVGGSQGEVKQRQERRSPTQPHIAWREVTPAARSDSRRRGG